MLIGEDGLKSTAIVEGLAQRMATGRVSENLRDTHLYSLNLEALLTGIKTTGELEARLQAVLAEASADQSNSILFVAELYQFVGKRAAEASQLP